MVLAPGIPDKGKVVTQLSNFWFRKFSDVDNPSDRDRHRPVPEELRADAPLLAGGSVVVRKCQRGSRSSAWRASYLAGSGCEANTATGGAVCGAVPPAAGLRQRPSELPEPIFTPATKAETGHDENISFDTMARALPEGEGERLRDLTLSLYRRAAEYSVGRGLILADTKLEFGRLDGRIVWIDEAFTPDSSRYWDMAHYAPGKGQPSFDKQFVRDWLESTGHDLDPDPRSGRDAGAAPDARAVRTGTARAAVRRPARGRCGGAARAESARPLSSAAVQTRFPARRLEQLDRIS